MAAIERTVRHLRLRAPSQAAAHRLVTTLEDALRCASLHDEGARLVVVRRLALGRVADGISPQALSRLIEQRLAALSPQWLDADADEAPQAPCVAFAGALQARIALALRLLRAQPVAAWYWPRAVAEFQVGDDAAANLHRIAWTIAGWPESRVALPAWLAELAQAGAGVRLGVAIGELQGEALLARAGLALPLQRVRAGRQDVQSSSPPSVPNGVVRAVEVAGTPLARWLAFAVASLPAPPPWLPARRGQDLAPLAQPTGAHRRETRNGAAPTVQIEALRSLDRAGAPVFPGAPATARVADMAATPAQVPARFQASVERLPRPASPPWSSSDSAQEVLPATACGGLLFQLPVLERCGLPAWCGEVHGPAFTAALLHRALLRAHAPRDDPLWQLAPTAPGLPPLPGAAPAGWSRPWSEALLRSRSADEQAAAWLHVARCWLHRAARLGLVRLVRRPARVAWTPTHVDLHFALDQADLRLRRTGLDHDPGWLPWFGRVVAFHFGVLP